MGKSAAGEQQVTEYSMSMHIGIGVPIDNLLEIQIGEKTAWAGNVSATGQFQINARELFGGIKKEGGVAGNAYFLSGADDQVLPGSLAARFGLTPTTSPGYRGYSSIFLVGDAVTDGSWAPVPGTTDGGGGTEGGWTPPGGNGRPCCAPWTKILLANEAHDGPGEEISAEDLTTDHWVWTLSEVDFTWGAYRVLGVRRVRKTERWRTVFIDGRVYTGSKDHRFLSPAHVWTYTHDLVAGSDVLGRLEDGVVVSTAPFDIGDVMQISIDIAQTYVGDDLVNHNLKPIPED